MGWSGKPLAGCVIRRRDIRALAVAHGSRPARYLLDSKLSGCVPIAFDHGPSEGTKR